MLRMRPLGEADRIIVLFSRERGKINAVAKGARKPRSKFGGRLDFFTRVNLMLHAGRSLDVVTGAQTVRAIWEQLVDPDAFSAASYVAEVVDALCEVDMAVPDLYDALCEFQDALAKPGDIDTLLAAMDLKVLGALGFTPELDACARCGAVLGARPLSGGRAWLSPQAGGLLCTACVRSLRADSAGSSGELISVAASDFARLRALRDSLAGDRERTPATLAGGDQGAHLPTPAPSKGVVLTRITRSFVEQQMGRRSKVHESARARTKPRAHKA